jgi:uncharacterized protein
VRHLPRYLLALLLAALTLLGLSRLSFDVEFLRLLPQHLGQVKGLSLLLQHFSQPQEIVITIESADADLSSELSNSLAATLRDHPDLIQQVVDAPPWESQPDQLAELLAFAALNSPPPAFAALLQRLDPAQATANANAAFATLNETFSLSEATLLGYDPFGILPATLGDQASSLGDLSEFSSPDGKFRLIYAEAATPLTSYRSAGAWLNQLQTLIAHWKSKQSDPSTFQIGITGEPVFLAEISASMERDMILSGITTLILVALIFWLFYRRFRPMFLLLGTIALAFVLSLAVAGLILSQITVLSVGFASILIGLSVDYGLLIYQRRLVVAESLTELRRHTAPTIGWAALTTASAFLALNAGHFPGLAQLGTLVALGILIAAALMLGPFAAALNPLPTAQPILQSSPHPNPSSPSPLQHRLAWLVLTLLTLACLPLITQGFPILDHSTTALHPKNSLAYQTSARIEQTLLDQNRRSPFIISADQADQMPARLQQAEQWLADQQQAGRLTHFWLPTGFWPSHAHQMANLQALADLPSQASVLQTALENAGFTTQAFSLTAAVLEQWQRFARQPLPFYPNTAQSQWTLRRTIHLSPTTQAVSGLITPTPQLSETDHRQLFSSPAPGLYPSNWSSLGADLAEISQHDFSRIALLFFAILIIMLGFAYRNALDVLLTFLVVAFAFLALNGIMAGLGMPWNFFSLASILLILGTGVDYSIHILLGLRHSKGQLHHVMHTIGRPIALCGLSTIAGFGSLGFASNRGLASLGIVCALGILLNLLLTLFVLPHLWRRIALR